MLMGLSCFSHGDVLRCFLKEIITIIIGNQ